jgi:hypothetical protein
MARPLRYAGATAAQEIAQQVGARLNAVITV